IISHAVYLSVNRSGENCINRLHRNFLSLPYTRNQHSSDRFEAQYKVLDGLFKLSGVSGCNHGLRPNKLAEEYNVQIPTWAEVIDGKSLLSRLRNDLAHEAIYAGKSIGYAHPKENYDIDFSSFNVELIASILGVKTNYLATSSQDRQRHLWHIV
uniref:hypothetical protein n=1 Tax=Vibrio parahaemolyticus TaxID=670 RepID=UPI0023620E2B